MRRSASISGQPPDDFLKVRNFLVAFIGLLTASQIRQLINVQKSLLKCFLTCHRSVIFCSVSMKFAIDIIIRWSSSLMILTTCKIVAWFRCEIGLVFRRLNSIEIKLGTKNLKGFRREWLYDFCFKQTTIPTTLNTENFSLRKFEHIQMFSLFWFTNFRLKF